MRPQATRTATETWTIRADRLAARELRAHIKAFVAGTELAARPLSDVCLAVSEAVGNVVLHGYVDLDEPGLVEVTATLSDTDLRIVISDHGSGMRPRDHSPGMGIGLPLIATLADECEIREREPSGTEVHLRFDL